MLAGPQGTKLSTVDVPRETSETKVAAARRGGQLRQGRAQRRDRALRAGLQHELPLHGRRVLPLRREPLRLPNPRNPRRLGKIEGGGNSLSGWRTIKHTQSL